MAAPLLPVAAALSLGIALGPAAHLSPAVLIALAAACLVVAAAALATGGPARIAAVGVLASIVSIGALREAGPVLPADHIARVALPSAVTIEGTIVSEPIRWAADRARLLVQIDALRDGPDRRPASGRVQVTVYGEAPPLGDGQKISATVRLHPPVGFRNPGGFDYPAQLRRDGVLLVGTARGDRVVPLSPDVPSWPVLVKRWAVGAIARHLPEGSSALLAGLLLGDRTALPREVDDGFRRAGVYHLLAVSGFNVALLASSVFSVLALAGVSRRPAAVCGAAVLMAFALVVGGQPSVLRATVMGLLLLGGVLLDRESHVMNALALAALVLLLWHPGDLGDPGFQLSFAATAGIVYLATPIAEPLARRGWPRSLATALGVSLGAQLAVTPIMLAHFNQLSLIGVAANLVVVPLAGPATTLGMLALASAAVSDALAAPLFNAVWLVLLALRATVWAAAAVPWAMIHLPAASWAAIAGWYAVLVSIPLIAGRRWLGGCVAALLVALTALSLWPWLRPDDGRLRITFVDVGQGDCTLIELPGRRAMLVDGGPGGAHRFDVGERVVAPLLWNRAVRRLDVVALSHADIDHAGGLVAVLRHFAVGEFWENGVWTGHAQDVQRAVDRSGAPRRVLRAGDRLSVGSAAVTVLGPDGITPARANDQSLVLRLDWRGLSLLLTGDLAQDGEAAVVARGGPTRALVLKVAHHGSRFSSTPAFLEASRPSLAVISVGARNPFGHPAPETLARLADAGARIYRTDRDGAVVIETDGRRVWITRWARRSTEVFDPEPEPGTHAPDEIDLGMDAARASAPEHTATPGLRRGSPWDAREAGG